MIISLRYVETRLALFLRKFSIKEIGILKTTCFFVVLLILTSAALNEAQADVTVGAKKEVYRFGVPLTDAGEYARMMDVLQKALAEKTGYSIVVGSDEGLGDDSGDVIKSMKSVFKNRGMDFMFMNPYLFVKLRNAGVGIHALLTWTMGGKKHDRGCLYVPEKSSFTALEELIGKKVIVVNTNDMEMLNYLLYERGVVPPDKEKQFDFDYSCTASSETNVENAAYVVDSGLAAAAFFKESDLRLLRMRDARLARLKSVACTSPMLNFPIVYREGVPEDVVDKVKQALLKAHKDPAFRELRVYILALDAKFVPITDKDYDAWTRFIETTERYGWKAPVK